MKIKNVFLSGVTAVSLAALSACGSSGVAAVPVDYIETPTFERHEIGVKQRTEVLEVDVNPADVMLPREDRDRIKNFVRAYADRGHGPLTMLLPEGSSNPQMAINSVVEAREIAFAYGVEYEEIEGGATRASNGMAKLFLSFKSYEAIAPECETLATISVSSPRLNNELPNFGCTVRANLAAMIADPADLLGQRGLDAGDTVRRQTTFDLYRRGEQTGAERNQGERGTLSDAVDDQG
ncbi:MAG: CpaD family pilus assembly protein [Pseudomonadota bacterium]